MDWLVCIKSSTGCQDGTILSTDYILYIRSTTRIHPLSLLFARYVSSIADVISSHGMLCHQYADDTQLYVTAKAKVDTADALKTVSSCTHAVQSWFLLNDLLLNPDKSELMVIGTRTHVKAYTCEDHVDIAGTLLKVRVNVKSLGVTFDRELSFDKHVNLVCRACNYYMWSLRHIWKYLTVDMANTIACSVVSSRLDYCNFIIYKTTIANITKLQCVQNSLARVMLQMPRRAHAHDLLAQLHWLPVSYRIEYKIALITYKALKFGQPRYLADLLIHQHQVRVTRSEGQCRLHQPMPNCQTSSRGFRYAAPSIGNLLPPDLWIKETALTFKTGLKHTCCCQRMDAWPVVKRLWASGVLALYKSYLLNYLLTVVSLS